MRRWSKKANEGGFITREDPPDLQHFFLRFTWFLRYDLKRDKNCTNTLFEADSGCRLSVC